MLWVFLLDTDFNPRAGPPLIGARLGTGTGAILGNMVGHAAVGPLIGGPRRTDRWRPDGDQLMVQEKRLTIESEQNQRDIERLRRKNERLREECIER